MKPPLLEVRNLQKSFAAAGSKKIEALRGVSLTLESGEVLGIAGGSGSGKSTLARILCGLERPDAGGVLLGGHDLGALRRGWKRRQFCRSVQMVFQDPGLSLDPFQRVGEVLSDVFDAHRPAPKSQRDSFVGGWLQRVGLDPAFRRRRTSELSGGEKQRLAIARAVCLSPKLVILDEVTGSLDTLVRTKILSLLHELQRENALSYIWISHDLELLRHVADRVAVLFEGQIVEEGNLKILEHPHHKHTQELISASIG